MSGLARVAPALARRFDGGFSLPLKISAQRE
jgi:hypothetical protein